MNSAQSDPLTAKGEWLGGRNEAAQERKLLKTDEDILDQLLASNVKIQLSAEDGSRLTFNSSSTHVCGVMQTNPEGSCKSCWRIARKTSANAGAPVAPQWKSSAKWEKQYAADRDRTRLRNQRSPSRHESPARDNFTRACMKSRGKLFQNPPEPQLTPEKLQRAALAISCIIQKKLSF